MTNTILAQADLQLRKLSSSLPVVSRESIGKYNLKCTFFRLMEECKYVGVFVKMNILLGIVEFNMLACVGG